MGRATLQDIAETLGISKMTVSRSLRGIGRVSPDTRNRVREAARALGYPVSADYILGQPVHRGSSDHSLKVMVPIVTPSRREVTGDFSQEILNGIRDRLALNEGSLEAVPCRSVDEILGAWQDTRANGLVIREQLPVRWITALREAGPIVYAISTDFYPDVDAVYTNEMRSAACLLRHLHARGHKDIAWLGIYDRNEAEVLPQELFEDLTQDERARYSVHGPRYAAWHYVARDSQTPQTTLFVDRDWRVESLGDAVARGLDQLLARRPHPSVVVVPSAGMANEIAVRAPELEIVCYGLEPHVLPGGRTCTTMVLPMYHVGRAIPDLIERRLADPDALPLTLMFEAAIKPKN